VTATWKSQRITVSQIEFSISWHPDGEGVTVVVNRKLTAKECRRLAIALLTAADKVEEESS